MGISTSNLSKDFLVPHGLMFHRFHHADEHPIGQGSVSGEELERLLDTIDAERILDPETWLQELDRGTLPSGSLCLTFDDGLKSQIEVALPILEERGLKAFWFVFSNVFQGGIDRKEIYGRFATQAFPSFDIFVDAFLKQAALGVCHFDSGSYRSFRESMKRRFSFYSENDIRYRFARNNLLDERAYDSIMEAMMRDQGTDLRKETYNVWMNEEDLVRLSRSGHVIGLHSYTHPASLKDMSLEKQREEYQKNKDHIISVIKKDVKSVAHPLDSYNDETLNILLDIGIYFGFRSNMSMSQVNCRKKKKLTMPRKDSNEALRNLAP